MKNFIFVLSILLLLLSSPLTDSMINIDSSAISILNQPDEQAPSSPTEPEPISEDSVMIQVPDWLVAELTEPIISAFISFECDYSYEVSDDNSYIYYLDEDDYYNRMSGINPPDFALVTQIYPEDYSLVKSVQVNESGDSIDVSVYDNSFFTSSQRAHIHELAYQCALVKCMQGIDENDIDIAVNYTVIEGNEKIAYTLPYKMKSVVESTDDMQKDFVLHIPVEYTFGDAELTKQQLVAAGVEEITINNDGTLDYTASKALILGMEADYYTTLQILYSDLVAQYDYIKAIYYGSLRTYLTIEVDYDLIDQNELFSLMDFLSYNNQFLQLFAGVKPEDIQFKISVVDSEYKGIIAELIYPKFSE